MGAGPGHGTSGDAGDTQRIVGRLHLIRAMRTRSECVTLSTTMRIAVGAEFTADWPVHRNQFKEVRMRGTGRVVFAATLLLIVGTLNIIYGIGALDGANVFVNDQRYILTDLNTLGWVLIVLGLIQLAGGFSLMVGNTYGRVIGIAAGTLGAIGALLSVGGAYPWWSLAIFALCVYVVHGIIVFGEDEPAAAPASGR